MPLIDVIKDEFELFLKPK